MHSAPVRPTRPPMCLKGTAFVLALAAGWLPLAAGAATPRPAPPAPAATATAAEAAGPSELAPPMSLTVGKSTLLRLPAPIDRISVGNPAVADVTLTSNRELYVLGKSMGSTNVILWRKGGPTTVLDVMVHMDGAGLQQQLATILPEEKEIQVRATAGTVVMTGTVSSAVKADHAVSIAESFLRVANPGAGQGSGNGSNGRNNGPKVINLLQIAQPQQVMLDVKVAEVSRTLLDKLGARLDLARTTGSLTYGIITSALQDVFGSLAAVDRRGNLISIDAKREDGLVKVLAEPNIVAVSGQEASFLAGGKVFIPVARNNNNGTTTITLEEKEFGVGLKFTPVVLDGGAIHLKVAPEVSELSKTGSPFVTAGGATAVLPSFTTRRAATTVQLRDGQSLAIAGLIKNNVTETINRFPFLGEIPVLGALFRSSEFQTDRSELIFVITPRLIKALPGDVALPTDNFTPPSRSEMLLGGKLEGSGRADALPDRPAAAAPTGPEEPVAPPADAPKAP